MWHVLSYPVGIEYPRPMELNLVVTRSEQRCTRHENRNSIPTADNSFALARQKGLFGSCTYSD